MNAEETDVVLDSLPDAVVAAMEVRDAWRKRKGQQDGLEFLISDLARWRPGTAVRVAFLDGDDALHKDVADATRQITDACNLRLDFGESGGKYRRWKTTDTAYAAEIRVSFDKGGFWSLVGTDSTDSTISDPLNGIGGGPGQRSLNLGGFATHRPDRWQGTVRHEFLHALAFHHAHQNLRGTCEQEFRWEDDPGYVPTRDDRGVFVPDAQGRRPGIYTYLGGPPNNWPRNKVDHNLRTVESPDVIAGPFDPKSVMLYRFQPFFYKSDPSACAPTGDGLNLSDGDKRGLDLLYPHTEAELHRLGERATTALETLTGEESTANRSVFEQRVIDLLGEW
ncbi:hypothetical protein LZG04_16160 [Saccharothrix sp. S26]|uniref:hypothetical protein n=1 Tax=Saccharothrix sp. S26 TaxID=2907215 RepID=UPI001F19D1C5|nr:hypothetical protein [Saccharothrix sp. S26]MCE6996319.1 hypothetical protein [Saccharothrix sp. S26]